MLNVNVDGLYECFDIISSTTSTEDQVCFEVCVLTFLEVSCFSAHSFGQQMWFEREKTVISAYCQVFQTI